MVTKGRNQTLLSFLICILLVRPSYSQTDKLLQGELLKDGEELQSAYGNFRLGFFSPDYSTTNRYLGIWYHKPATYYYNYGKIEPVWVANRNTPILDKSGRLAIDSSDGNLKILHSGGDPIVVSSIQTAANTGATLDKSGNFVLYERSSNGTVKQKLWQSFDYPTDTLLPGMKLGIDLKTGRNWSLRSWITEDCPAAGSYILGIHPNDTKKLTIWKQNQVEWTSGVWLTNSFNDSDAGYYYCRHNFSYTSNEQETYFSYSVYEDITSFPALKIDEHGLLGDESKSAFGDCNIFGGCKSYVFCDEYWSDFQVNYVSKSVKGINFRGGEVVTFDECKAECSDKCCYAFASTTDNKINKTSCEIWQDPTKFRESYRPDDRRQIYIGVRKAGLPWLFIGLVGALAVSFLCSVWYGIRRQDKAKEEKWWQTLGLVLLVPLLFYLCYAMGRKLKARVDSISNRRRLLRELDGNASMSLPFFFGKEVAQQKDQSMKHELKIFDFQILAAATNNFSITNKLGQGGFGPVYKGKLSNGQEIAIKKLSKSSGQGILEFTNEAKLIAKLQHTNLVKLLGCSLHGGERILVYEYMPNKSLDFFIYDSSRKVLLTWRKHFEIIQGIAQGLLYLHKYSRLKVIHRDLKAGNILLDDQMNPKISDFGMARIFKINESVANTNRVCGTFGYMSPEYAMNGIVSTKIDVFSFGVLILEIVSGKKNNSCYHTESPLNLVGFAWQLWNEGKVLELIDPTIDHEYSPNEALRCIHVGLLCVQDQAADRPTMFDVVSMLINETTLLPEPKQPAFFINVTIEEPEFLEPIPENCSINDVTISEMVAR